MFCCPTQQCLRSRNQETRVTFSLKSLVTVLELLFLCFSRNFACAWLCVWIWFHLGSKLRSECSKKFVIGAIVSVANDWWIQTWSWYFFYLIATGSCLSPWNYWYCATKSCGMSKKCVIHINWFMGCFRAVVWSSHSGLMEFLNKEWPCPWTPAWHSQGLPAPFPAATAGYWWRTWHPTKHRKRPKFNSGSTI